MSLKSGKNLHDKTRMQKLLNKQKEGKKRLRAIGNVEIGDEVFRAVMRLDD